MKNSLMALTLATLSFSASALPPPADQTLTDLLTNNVAFKDLLVSKLAENEAGGMGSNFEGIKIETVSPHTGKAAELCGPQSRSAIAFKVTLSDKRYVNGEETTVKEDYYFAGGREQVACAIEEQE
jgi:hypothetical protein